jgi:hypothetical protein
MNIEKMREQFEAKFPIPAGVAWKESIGMYEVVDIWKLDQAITIGKYNWLWEGWQASREAVVVELPSACAYEGLTDHLGSVIELSYEAPEHDPVGLARLPDVRFAIEAQGLKVGVKP